jgi:hypothetical protein
MNESLGFALASENKLSRLAQEIAIERGSVDPSPRKEDLEGEWL